MQRKTNISVLIAITGSLMVTSSFVQAAPIIMEGSYIRTAISDNGTLGFGGGTSPGLLHDPSGTGTFGVDDYLTPGTPWEIFSVREGGGGLQVNNNAGAGDMAQTSLTDISGSSPYDNHVRWEGTGTNFVISNDYFFNNGDERISISTMITAVEDLTGLSFARAIDPDPDVVSYGSYSTVNGRGYGTLAPEDWVHSAGSSTGLTLGLLTDSSTPHNTGIDSGWSTDPVFYLSGADDGNGDYTIGLGFDIGELAKGDSITLEYAYVMGDSLASASSGTGTVPEPAAIALMGVSLLGMRFRRRQQSKS